MLDGMTNLRGRFRDLHSSGTFLMPNPWDVGSAKMLIAQGFPALATTSSGFAGSLGRTDQRVTRDELLRHAEAMAGAAGEAGVPVNVDAENGFGDEPEQVATTARLLAATTAAGFSIEDWDPVGRRIYPLELAVERVAAAKAEAADLVFTARAENQLRQVADLDDTIARLQAYSAAGADVLYAPGLTAVADIQRVLAAVDKPLNVLVIPSAPSVQELTALGVRRISTGQGLAVAGYAALLRAADQLRAGDYSYAAADPNPLSLLD